MATVSDGVTTITPALIIRYEAAQDAQNVFHPIIGVAAQDVTLRPASLRRGTLEMLFTTAADADAARVMLAKAAVFTYADPDVPTAGMHFALDGNLTPAIEDETRELWTLAVGYREVAV